MSAVALGSSNHLLDLSKQFIAHRDVNQSADTGVWNYPFRLYNWLIGNQELVSDSIRKTTAAWWKQQFEALPPNVQRDIILDEMKRWARAKLQDHERPSEQRIEEYALELYQDRTQVQRAKRYLVDLTPQGTRNQLWDPMKDLEVPAHLESLAKIYLQCVDHQV